MKKNIIDNIVTKENNEKVLSNILKVFANLILYPNIIEWIIIQKKSAIL